MARSNGGGVLLGEEDRPFPNMLGTTMKYFFGSRDGHAAIRASFSACCPP
jgi:hypothetical protein